MWIELSEFNFKLIIPLIFPIFKRIGDFTKKSYMKKDNQLFKAFRYFTSYLFSFIFYITLYYRTRTKIIEKSETESEDSERLTYVKTISSRTMNNTISELKIQNTKRKQFKSVLFLSLLCGLGLFCYFFRFIFEKDEFKKAKQSIGIFFDIALYIILSYVILKQKLYKHSYISAGIIALMLLILFIISTFYIEGKVILYSFIYYFFYSLCFVLYDILKKKYMSLFYNSPYFMMLVIGAVNIILVLIYDAFAYNLNPDISGIIIGLKININSVGNFFKFPCHYFISEYISEYIYYIMNAMDYDEDFYSTANIIIFSISYFINFLCCLVFNEVVILNFCGLDYNTKKRIKQRILIEEQSNNKETQMMLVDENSDIEIN